MAGNKDVDIGVGNNQEGSDPLLLCVFIFLGLLVCCCFLRERRHFAPGTVIGRILPTTEADQEARKKFVDKHLVVQDWSQKKSKNDNSGTVFVSGDVEEGAAKEEDEDAPPQEADAQQDECPICLTAYNEGDEVSPSTNESCAHMFHRECVYEWLLQREECPMCRNTFLIEPETPKGAKDSHADSGEQEILVDEGTRGGAVENTDSAQYGEILGRSGVSVTGMEELDKDTAPQDAETSFARTESITSEDDGDDDILPTEQEEMAV